MASLILIISMLSNFFLLLVWNFLGKFIGLLKMQYIVGFIGTGVIGDLFFTVMKWPDIARKITVDGILHYCLMPYLISTKLDNKEAYKKSINSLFSFFVIIFLIVTILGVLLAPLFCSYILKTNAVKFSNLPMITLVSMYQMCFPLIFLVVLGALLMSFANSNDEFKRSSATNFLGNLLFLIFLFSICNIFPLFLMKNPYFTVHTLIGSHIFSFTGQFLWLFFILRKSGLRLAFTLKFNIPRHIYSTLLKGISSQILLQSYNIVCSFIAHRLKTTGFMACLAMSEKTVQSITGSVGLISIAIMPILKTQYKKDYSKGSELTFQYFVAILSLISIITVFCYFFLPSIIILVFKSKKHVSNILMSKIIKTQVFSIPLVILIRFFNSIIATNENMSFIMIIGFIGAIASAGLEFFLYRKIDYLAVIIGMYSSLVIQFILAGFRVYQKKYISFRIKEFLKLNSPLFLCFVGIISGFILREYLPCHNVFYLGLNALLHLTPMLAISFHQLKFLLISKKK